MLKLYVEAPTTDKSAMSCLFDNLNLILANREKVLSHEKYKNIKITGLYVGGLYVGMHILSLGDILTLWDSTVWHADTKYYYNIIGSPLSGTNQTHWYDTETKQFEVGPRTNEQGAFWSLVEPALKHLKTVEANRKISDLSIFDLVKQL